VVTGDLQANFNNCIFWGNYGIVSDEVTVSRQANDQFSVDFSNCLWKVKTPPSIAVATNMIVNQDPLFDSVNTSANFYNFRLQSASPAAGAGMAAGILIDLDGNPRPAMSPDLGCYQR
jgi:hypothetical protein